MSEGRKWHFQASRFKNFLGEHAPRPPWRLAPPTLTCPPQLYYPCYGTAQSREIMVDKTYNFIAHCCELLTFSFVSLVFQSRRVSPKRPLYAAVKVENATAPTTSKLQHCLIKDMSKAVSSVDSRYFFSKHWLSKYLIPSHVQNP